MAPPAPSAPGLQLAGGHRIDASAFGSDYDEAFFGGDGLQRLAQWAAGAGKRAAVVADDERLGPPLCRPSKIVCVGLNYRDHARESGMAVPTEPVIFLKATSALSGPNDDVVIPRGSMKTDWEVELAIVIGRKASYVDESVALDHVAGYVLHKTTRSGRFSSSAAGNGSKARAATPLPRSAHTSPRRTSLATYTTCRCGSR